MSLKNNCEYKITDLNLDGQTYNRLCLTNSETINKFKLYKVINFFKRSYCFTVDGAEGMKISQPFFYLANEFTTIQFKQSYS
jgi:hypothetical protein